MLEEEQERLLAARFGRDREIEYEKEIEELRKRLETSTQDLSDQLDFKTELHNELKILKENLHDVSTEKSEIHKKYFETCEELEHLREKFRFFSKDGEVDLSEVEEALAVVRLRREKGISIDFMYEVDELYSVNSGFKNNCKTS